MRFLFGSEQQVAIGPVDVTAHAAAKLVQIGQAVAVGLVDENRVGVGDVQAALDDRRRQQEVEAVGHEVQHHPLQLVLGHLAVGDADAGLGHDLAEPLGERLDVLHAVVDEVDLPLPVQLPQHGLPDQLGIEARDAGFHRQPVFGRGFQVRDVADADQAHVQRAGDRRGGHRQHVDGLPHGLEPLLDLDAEPLLLVDDDQAQVVELHVRLHEAVRADDDVDRAGGQPLDDFGLLPRAWRTARGRRSRRETRPSARRRSAGAARPGPSSARAPPPGSRNRSP